MKLANGELRPGLILEVLDGQGTIRAEVPGLFSAVDKENLPPIYPFAIGSSNSFSTPNKGDEVWVLSFTDNPRELYWFRKDNFAKNNGEGNKGGKKCTGGGNIQDQKNVEVLMSRESNVGYATIYFSDGTGWVIQNQDAIIELGCDSIQLTTRMPHGTIEITEDGISLGTAGGSAHPVPHGDKVEKLFDNIISTFRKISEAAKTNPYTAALSPVIDTAIANFENDPSYISSNYVTVD